ncbi:MAG: ATP phosphoribosyltransferase [Coriobacteriales bacterium]|nr:ATP phosphoribosyltransferase [Coriobacteriales bacterium]
MDKLKIALAKGRLAKKSFDIFKEIGLYDEAFDGASRKLIFTNETCESVLVKASDVPIYVERGAADVGIVGRDSLLESGADVYEILDLNFGKCKFCVAAPKDFNGVQGRKLRVASKYTKVAGAFYENQGQQVDLIKLEGSVELAPIVNLSDVIVDIVETGSTLKENGLVVIDEICDISARFISNKASFKTKAIQIRDIIKKLNEYLEG